MVNYLIHLFLCVILRDAFFSSQVLSFFSFFHLLCVTSLLLYFSWQSSFLRKEKDKMSPFKTSVGHLFCLTCLLSIKLYGFLGLINDREYFIAGLSLFCVSVTGRFIPSNTNERTPLELSQVLNHYLICGFGFF